MAATIAGTSGTELPMRPVYLVDADLLSSRYIGHADSEASARDLAIAAGAAAVYEVMDYLDKDGSVIDGFDDDRDDDYTYTVLAR
jgi:hypothetical protein